MGGGGARRGKGGAAALRKTVELSPHDWMDDMSLTGLGNTAKEKEPAAY